MPRGRQRNADRRARGLGSDSLVHAGIDALQGEEDRDARGRGELEHGGRGRRGGWVGGLTLREWHGYGQARSESSDWRKNQTYSLDSSWEHSKRRDEEGKRLGSG